MIKRIITILSYSLALISFSYPLVKGQDNLEHNLIELNYLHPTTYLLESIEVIGNNHLDSEIILAVSNLRSGDVIQIPGNEISHALKKLWQQKIIKDIALYAGQIADNRIKLYIHIAENPLLSTWSVEGVDRSDKEKLVEKLNLSPASVVTPQFIKTTQYLAEKYYLKQGYKDVSVQVTVSPDPADAAHVLLKIIVDKGEKFIINKILFKGNTHVPAAVLRSELKHINEKARFTLIKDILYKIVTVQPFRKGGILWNRPTWQQTTTYFKEHCIFSSSKLIAASYEKDKKNIITYYQNLGYKDAKITGERIYKYHKGLLNIVLNLEEGSKYYIRRITWVGNYLHSTSRLNKILRLRPGSIYSSSLLQERLISHPEGLDISSLYMNDGYLFFHIEPVPIAIQGNQVDLEMRIQEGPQATLNNININGNNYTHDYIIRRELKTLPGEKFSKVQLIRSYRELAMLNLFDPNKIQINPLPNSRDNTADLDYTVKEAPKFDIKGGASLVGGAKLGINLNVGTNNFCIGNLFRGKIPIGAAQALHIKAEYFGIGHQDYSFQFIDPWIMGSVPTLLDVSGSYSLQRDRAGSSLSSFSFRSGLGRRLKWPDDYSTAKAVLKYGIYFYKAYDVLDNNGKLAGKTHEIALELDFERNSTDQPIYAKKGSIISLASRLTPPYSLFSKKDPHSLPLRERMRHKEYIQTTLYVDYFYNPLGDWVINLFVRGGAMGSYSKTTGPFARFVMGGTSMPDFSLLGREIIGLRGYPDKYILPVDKKTKYRGGVVFDKVGLELRYPIVKASNLFVYTLVFAEAGNAWAHYYNWKIFDLKKSMGIGFRFYLPIGLFGLDWGYGFDKNVTDKLEVHWILGMSSK